MERVKKYSGYRPTWAEVDLKNLAYNFRSIKSILAPQTKVMVTVKADAYGHGIIPVSRALVNLGVDFLGVASIDEGIVLRKAGIKVPVLVLGMILKQDIVPIFKYNLAVTVADEVLARAISVMAVKSGKSARVHIKVDTGMGRIGVWHSSAEQLIRKVFKMRGLIVDGLFTHFAFADLDKEFTGQQIDIFVALLKKMAKLGINVPYLHAANSMGVIDYRHSHFNMVRPGLVIYGLLPKKDIRLKLKPVLSLKSRVVFSKKVGSHTGISYGHDYITAKPTRIVTLPIGYGDGYPRNLSNKAPVLIKGRRFVVAGKVCMDQIMVDVGRLDVKAGESAVLIGEQGRNSITAEELAGLAGTIPYEIACGLGSRIPRVYLK